MKEKDKFFLDFETIDFLKYIKYLKKYKLLFLLLAILITSATFYISYKNNYYYSGSINFKNNKFMPGVPYSNKGNLQNICTNMSGDYIKSKFQDENNLLNFFNFYKLQSPNNEISFSDWKVKNIQISSKEKFRNILFEIRGNDENINQKMVNFGKSYFSNIVSTEINNCLDKANENLRKEITNSKNEMYSMTKEIYKYISNQQSLSNEEQQQFKLFGELLTQEKFGSKKGAANYNQSSTIYPQNINILNLSSDSLNKFLDYKNKISYHRNIINSFEKEIQDNLLRKTKSFDYIRVTDSTNIISKNLNFLAIESVIIGTIFTFLFSLSLFFFKDMKKINF